MQKSFSLFLLLMVTALASNPACTPVHYEQPGERSLFLTDMDFSRGMRQCPEGESMLNHFKLAVRDRGKQFYDQDGGTIDTENCLVRFVWNIDLPARDGVQPAMHHLAGIQDDGGRLEKDFMDWSNANGWTVGKFRGRITTHLLAQTSWKNQLNDARPRSELGRSLLAFDAGNTVRCALAWSYALENADQGWNVQALQYALLLGPGAAETATAHMNNKELEKWFMGWKTP